MAVKSTPGTGAPVGWGQVIKGPGTSVATSNRPARGMNYQATKNGPKGDAAQQAHANTVNQIAYQANANVFEHKEKLAAQLEYNERMLNVEAHQSRQRIVEAAAAKLAVTHPRDLQSLHDISANLHAGNSELAGIHADVMAQRQAFHQQAQKSMAESGVASGAQLKEHVQAVAPEPVAESVRTAGAHDTEGFTPVGTEVSEREKSDKVNAEPPENPPEAETPPTNVPGATKNVTEGVDEPLKDKPVVQEAEKKVEEAPKPVATPPSAAGNSDTKAPTPGEQKTGSISDSVQVGSAPAGQDSPTVPTGIPAVGAAAASQQNKDAPSRVSALVQGKRDVERKQAPVKERYAPVGQAIVKGARAINERRKAQAAVNEQQMADEAAQNPQPEKQKQKQQGTPITPESVKADEAARAARIQAAAASAPSAKPDAGSGRSKAHFDAAAVAHVGAAAVTGAATGAKVTPGGPVAKGVGAAVVGTASAAKAAFEHHKDAPPGATPGTDLQEYDRPRYLPRGHPDAPEYNKKAKAHAATMDEVPLPPKKKEQS